jgi:Flp pilus assembly pilin Flp
MSLVERRYKKMTVHPRLVAIIDRIRQVDGQGLAEYALILALIAIISIVSLIFLGSQVSDKMSVIGSHLQSVAH